MQKKHKPKKSKRRDKTAPPLSKFLSLYFAAHILCAAAFAVGAGTYLARRNSEAMLYAAGESCITMEDLNKWLADLRSRLVHSINNKELRDFFKNIY